MILGSIPKSNRISLAKNTPKKAMIDPPIRVINNNAPTMVRTFSISLAPHACPTKTVAPVDRPITKASNKNRIGKNTEIAAIASTPSICPTKMVLIVPDRFCRILVRISGPRKIKKTFQNLGW
jgi:hypothetical protein